MDLRDIINKNDPGPIMKIMNFVQGLGFFTLFTSMSTFIGWIIVCLSGQNLFLCGELLGICLISAMIFVWLFSVLLSIIPPGLIDQIYKDIHEELEREKEEKKKKRKSKKK